MTLEWPRPWMSLAVASTWPETEIKTRRKPWLEKTRQNPMGNLRWRINVPKLRVDSWMNHMDTLISFSTWIFIDFNGYSQIFSLYQKCPPKPVLPSLSFFFHPKKSQISNSYFVSSLSDFFISNDTNLSQLLPKKQTTSHFYMTYPTSTRNCYFYCLLNPIHFFLKKISPCAQLLQ